MPLSSSFDFLIFAGLLKRGGGAAPIPIKDRTLGRCDVIGLPVCDLTFVLPESSLKGSIRGSLLR